MDSIYVTGGKPLKGRIPISGAKNAALTLMRCALLTDEKVTLENLPRLADVDNFSHLLNQLGVSTKVAGVKKGEFGRRMTLQARDIASTVAPYDMVRRMRASILVLGPMRARAGGGGGGGGRRCRCLAAAPLATGRSTCICRRWKPSGPRSSWRPAM